MYPPFSGEPVRTFNHPPLRSPSSPSTTRSSASRLLRLALPALTLWAALATVGFSDAQQGALTTPPAVVQPAQSPATSGTQQKTPQLAKLLRMMAKKGGVLVGAFLRLLKAAQLQPNEPQMLRAALVRTPRRPLSGAACA